MAAKREQTLQEIPVAVAVVTADVMNEAQVLEIRDLQFLVPSLRVSQLQTSANATFLIRGFGNGANNAGVEPSVGVFIDGVYRSRSAASLADFPNLERIEVSSKETGPTECGGCGATMKVIGTDRSERLDYLPAKVGYWSRCARSVRAPAVPTGVSSRSPHQRGHWTRPCAATASWPGC